MHKRQLGKQGLTVSSIGLGYMGMSDFYGSHDHESSFATLDQAVRNGVTFWDTSDIYGPKTNEQLIGKFFKKRKGARSKITLATKFGIMRDDAGNFLGFNGHPDYVKQACDASLRRLGTDCIDLYYQHRMDPNIPIEDTVGAMSDLVTQGKVRYLGLSEAGADTLKRAHAVHPISALQSEYSLWSRDIETTILPTCDELGIGLVAYSPLGRGFLTGAIKSRDDLESGDWRLTNPRFSEQNFANNLTLVKEIHHIAVSLNCTPAQLALAWIAERSPHYVSIPGTRSPSRMIENAAAAELIISQQQWADINHKIERCQVFGLRYKEEAMAALGQ